MPVRGAYPHRERTMHRITRRVAALLACVVGFAGADRVLAAPKSSEENVKITAKIDKDVVTLTVEIAKGWHLYANPVGNPDLLSRSEEHTSELQSPDHLVC